MTVPVQDHWAALNHKAIMRDEFVGDVPLPPTWVPRNEKRRLNAYSILGAYLSNNAAVFVRATEDVKAERREYGDAGLLVSQTAAAVIGRDARLSVAGADRPPEEPPPDASPEQKAEFERVKAKFPQLVERQRQLDGWAEDEQWHLRLAEAEDTAMGLGDAVYWLTWSGAKKRAMLRVLDPGLYFPVYGPRDDGKTYPSRVHLAWEYEDEDARGQLKKFVRRITYELVDIEPRKVRYQEEPVTQTCLLTDLTWDLSDVQNDVADLSDAAAVIVEMNDDGQPLVGLDLMIDFIPVVHVPNKGHLPWGTSLLAQVAQILDDLQVSDTDAADAASVAGGPPIVIAGATTQETYTSYGPRTVWEVPTGGAASVLDTSEGLASLHEHVDRLDQRLSSNSQVPREVLGKVKAADVSSGVQLALSFGPFEVLIARERLVRRFKYALLFKMVQRMHIAGGAWEGEVFPAGLTFGSALPSDISALTEILKKLLGDRQIISRVTAIRMLADAGLSIPDIAIEADRVDAEDYEGANLLYRATRSPALAADKLGLELPEDVLMDQLSKLLGKEVKLDDIRDLFIARQASQSIPPAQDPANVDPNPQQGGRQPGPSRPDAKQQRNVNAGRRNRDTKR